MGTPAEKLEHPTPATKLDDYKAIEATVAKYIEGGRRGESLAAILKPATRHCARTWLCRRRFPGMSRWRARRRCADWRTARTGTPRWPCTRYSLITLSPLTNKRPDD